MLVLQNKKDIPRGKFRTPYVNSKFIMPVLLVVAVVLSFTYNKESTMSFLTNERQLVAPADMITSMSEPEIESFKAHLMKSDSAGFSANNLDTESYLSALNSEHYIATLQAAGFNDVRMYETGWALFQHKIPMWIFIIIVLVLTYYAITQNLSLIPLLGLISCLYMMAELGVSNWIGFGIWLAVGLIVYFAYSSKNSKLNKTTA